MISVNHVTGELRWENFVLYPRLFHENFVENHPHIKPSYDELTVNGTRERIYRFPPINLDTYSVKIQLTYYDSKLSGINIGRENSIESDEEADYWRRTLPGWVEVAHKWLVSQLGQPHEFARGVFYDEKEWLTPEEIHQLQSWEYHFEWGRAGFYYDGLQQPGDIFLHYSYHQQVQDWDELSIECENFLQKQANLDGKYTGAILATLDLIDDILRPHFEYQRMKPQASYKGLVFREWSGLLTRREIIRGVTVHPGSVEKRYELWATNTLEKIFIAADDHFRLVDTLRTFLGSRRL